MEQFGSSGTRDAAECGGRPRRNGRTRHQYYDCPAKRGPARDKRGTAPGAATWTTSGGGVAQKLPDRWAGNSRCRRCRTREGCPPAAQSHSRQGTCPAMASPLGACFKLVGSGPTKVLPARPASASAAWWRDGRGPWHPSRLARSPQCPDRS